MAVGASVLTLAVLPATADQANPAASPVKTYTGTVAAVNPDGHTLEVKGIVFSKQFNLGDHCAYSLWNNPDGTLADLRPGEKVTVAYQDASGVLVADSIKQDAMIAEGTVKAIDPAAHTLTLHTGWMDKTYRLPDNCIVKLSGNQSSTLDSVLPGYHVTVTYETPNDRAVAREIAQTGADFTGELTAVDMADRTVTAKSMFDTKQFHLANDCSIMVNGHVYNSLSDLKLGDRMKFNYDDVKGVDIVDSIAQQPVSHQSDVTTTMPMTQP